jgi:hypothetical protein
MLRCQRTTASTRLTFAQTNHLSASPRFLPGAGYRPLSTPNVSPRYAWMAADSKMTVPSCTSTAP